MIELLERGALQQVGTGEGDPFESYFSGNTIQICPVGALTSAAYRFRSRPFDLVSSPSVCEHCAGGCATRTDHRRGKVMRRLAAERPRGQRGVDLRQGPLRASGTPSSPTGSTHPLVRDADGELEPGVLAGGAGRGGRAGLTRGARQDRRADRRPAHRRGRLRLRASSPGSRSTPTTSTSGPARTAPRRPTSWPPRVAGRGRDLDGSGRHLRARWRRRPRVLLAGLEAEEEAPGVFLRLRKAHRKRGQRTYALATHATRGLDEGRRHAAAGRARHRDRVAGRAGRRRRPATRPGGRPRDALRTEGAVILVGERLAAVPGGLDRRGPAGRRDRRPPGVDPAPGR